ncbi:MAG: ribosome maturation factor RimP [Anaeroplasmataceae bacterium]
MELNKVEEILKPYLEAHDLKLYEIKWVNEFGYKILQVSIDNKTGIDTDTLALCNEYLSKELDKYDSLMGEYMLEVCSPGAEKPLRNEEEVLESVGKYVCINTNSGEEIIGDLLEFTDNVLVIKINVKGRMKKVSVNYNDIRKIRLAVKF